MQTRSGRLLLLALFCLAAAPAQARRIAAITANNEFLTFDSTSPGTIDNPVAVTGLVPGDSLQAIDFRPLTGALYALGVNGSTGRIYTIDPTTKHASMIGDAPFSTALNTGNHYGFDFIPTVDRIRVTNSSDQNLRVNPNNGALSAIDPNVDNPSTSESIVGLAYDRNDRNPNTSTTLFGIDFLHDTLVRIGGIDGNPSANGGAVTTIGSTGFSTVFNEIGFDIADDGVAFASMATAGPLYRLYTIKLTTGAATLSGNIGTGTTVIRDISVFPNRVANINSGKFFVTIQSAINDAQTMAGDTITVNADTFQELVTVNKSVTLLGARAGFDARSPLLRGTQETVVNGADVSGGRTSAFHVTVNNVVIDGFTVQEAANIAQFSFGTGIFLDPNLAGTQIRNNIVQDNRSGLIISNNILNKPLIIERNLFRNNNTSGPDVDGPAIYSDSSYAGATFTSVVIDNNTFENNNFGVALFGGQPNSPQSNVVISRNIMVGNHVGLYLADLKESFVTDNQITNSIGSQIILGGGVDDVSISGNVIESGGSWGIRIGNYITGGLNQNILLGSNAIANNVTAGLEIESDANAHTGSILAVNNWWGQGSGPRIASNPGGTGQKLIDPGSHTTFMPFLNSAADYQAAEIGFQPYPAPTLYGINAANNNLVSFRADNLNAVTSVPITGLAGGELITALDFRSATGELFGLSNTNRLYIINPITGKAIQRGANGAFSLNGVSFGFDFDPTVDRIRVTSDARQNFRLNPNNGTVAGLDTELAYASGDPLVLSTPIVGGSAYLNNFSGASRTTLYNIDTEQNILTRQGAFSGTGLTSPNNGQLFSLGTLGLNPTDDGTRVNTGFDIFSPIPGVNIAYAALTTNGVSSSLGRVNLVSGAVTTLGPIGDFLNPILVRALAAAPAGQFEFSAPTYLVNETGPVATITINRVGGSQGSVTVDFATANGTAKAGSDYTDSDKVLTFANGVVSKTVQIPITNDSADESFTETILLSLKNPTNGAFLGAQASAVLSIKDDDLITPTLGTQESSPAVAVGEAIFNVAMISGTGSPGGTVTFQLYGPNVAGCSGAPAFTSIKQVNGNGNYASASFTPTLPGAYKWVVTYSGDGDHNGEVSSSCGAANQSFTATVTALGNIATRLRVDTGDNALIAGFIITGTQPKKVIVRGIGTSLPLSGNLANPILELRNSGGVLLDSNDDWKLSANKQAIIDTTIAPSRDQESAIVASLPANASGYTAILRGVNGGTGIGVVEAYDLGRLADSELANISTRGFVSTGDNVLIAGTIVVGKDPQKVIVRAIGPSLGLPNRMQDPTLELRNSNGGLIEANDNWKDSPNKQAIIDSTIPPTNDLESAIVATLPANNASYTAILRGANGTTGIAVVELYALP